jgi:hypothetical protein
MVTATNLLPDNPLINEWLSNIVLESPAQAGLDVLRDNSNGNNCPTPILLHLVNKVDICRQKIIYIPCDSWSCPYCRAKKANRIRERVRQLFQHRKVWMMTLTSRHYYTEEIQLAWLIKKWNLLLTIIRREHPEKVHFFRVVERHQDGYFHLHILIDVDLTTKTWKKIAIRSGFGHQYTCFALSNDTGAWYASKYILKTAYDDNNNISFFSKYAKRFYSFSERVTSDPEPSQWKILEILLEPAIQRSYMAFKRREIMAAMENEHCSVLIHTDFPTELEYTLITSIAVIEPQADVGDFRQMIFTEF